jgi:hypothetical protein
LGIREDFEALPEPLSRFKKRLRGTENGSKNESSDHWRLVLRIMGSKGVSTERITAQRDRKSIVVSTAQIHSSLMTIAAISMFSLTERKQTLHANRKSAHISYRGVQITHRRLEKRLTAFQKNTSTCQKTNRKTVHAIQINAQIMYALIAFLFSSSTRNVNRSVFYVKKTFNLSEKHSHSSSIRFIGFKIRNHSSTLCFGEMALRVLVTLAQKLERKFRLRLTVFPEQTPRPEIPGVTICYIQGSHNLLDTEGAQYKIGGKNPPSIPKNQA